jgi:hypothetical protein
MFAIAEVLHGTLQILRGVLLQIALYISREAFSQHFSASCEIRAQGALLTQDLVIRRTERDQRNADDEGNNEPDAE